MKKYQIVNKKRFAAFLLIIIFILVLTFIRFVSFDKKDFLSSFKEVEVRISKGDTSWGIQEKITPNKDIRKILYYAEKINGKNMGDIKPGELIIFLKEK